MLDMDFHRIFHECGTIEEGFGKTRSAGIEIVAKEDLHKITVSCSDELECDGKVATIIIPWGKIKRVEIIPSEKEKQIKRIKKRISA